MLIIAVEQQNRWAGRVSEKPSAAPNPCQPQNLIKCIDLSILTLNITQKEHISTGENQRAEQEPCVDNKMMKRLLETTELLSLSVAKSNSKHKTPQLSEYQTKGDFLDNSS